MVRLIVKTIGYLFLAIGFIGMLTPIPFGLIFFVLALLLLIPTSPTVVRLMQRARRKSHRFDTAMTGISRRLPSPYRRILKTTDVDILERTHF